MSRSLAYLHIIIFCREKSFYSPYNDALPPPPSVYALLSLKHLKQNIFSRFNLT